MAKLKLDFKLVALVVVGVVLLASNVLLLNRYESRVKSLESERAQRDLRTDMKSAEALRQDYYYSESATLVSPHTMRLNMDKGQVDFVLIDLRSAEDYERGHIRGAINIPFDGKPETIVKFRKALEEGNKERRSYAIVYCYSYACMLGRKTGQELSKHGISVKELSVGYNDWAQQHHIWNSPGEVYDINNYIVTGSQPGDLAPSKEFLNRSCSNDEKFAC